MYFLETIFALPLDPSSRRSPVATGSLGGCGMLKVYSCVTQDHDPRLLLVAVALCLLAQLTSFVLAGDLRRMNGVNAPRWLLVLAFITAMGIWATHFVSMLALQPQMPSAYSPGFTALSLAVCFALTLLAFTRTKSLRARSA